MLVACGWQRQVPRLPASNSSLQAAYSERGFDRHRRLPPAQNIRPHAAGVGKVRAAPFGVIAPLAKAPPSVRARVSMHRPSLGVRITQPNDAGAYYANVRQLRPMNSVQRADMRHCRARFGVFQFLGACRVTDESRIYRNWGRRLDRRCCLVADFLCRSSTVSWCSRSAAHRMSLQHVISLSHGGKRC
jgi:hypothetical protein